MKKLMSGECPEKLEKYGISNGFSSSFSEFEKIIKETIEIPFETITREVASSNTDGEKLTEYFKKVKME